MWEERETGSHQRLIVYYTPVHLRLIKVHFMPLSTEYGSKVGLKHLYICTVHTGTGYLDLSTGTLVRYLFIFGAV